MERSLPEIEKLLQDVDAELAKLIPPHGRVYMDFEEYSTRISRERASLNAKVAEIVLIKERLSGMEEKLVRQKSRVAIVPVAHKEYLRMHHEMVCTEKSITETSKLLSDRNKKYGWELNSHLVFLEGHIPANMQHLSSLRILLLEYKSILFEQYRAGQIRRCQDSFGLDTASLRAFAEACGEINRGASNLEQVVAQTNDEREVPPPPVPPAEEFDFAEPMPHDDFLVKMNWAL